MPPSARLPAPLTRFVGRERELSALEPLLLQSRLVTLVGPGGIGKTRIALELASRLFEHFEQRVWLVELAALVDPALIGQAVADTVAAADRPDRAPLQNVADALHDVPALLVLDNCEHMIDGCAAVADSLLRQCRRLTVLATSRQSLGIAGECAWRVPSMQGAEAMQLLADRARSVQPMFELDRNNEEPLARICRQLDGIPLALELAAARLNVLNAEQIATRLEAHLRVLAGGSRTALPRQRTLEATLDWSYVMLEPLEKTFFRRLAVFAGGWSVEAAELVCAGDGIDSDNAFDLLAQLVDKSLVQAELAARVGRYRLLEPVRAYAMAKLRESGEEADLRRLHRDCYDNLAQRIAERWQARKDAEHLDAIEQDLDNLRSAVEWCREVDDAEAGLRLLDTLWFYWNVRGHLGEWRERVHALLALPSARQSSPMRVRGLNVAGYLALAQGEDEAARVLHQQALALADEVGSGGDATIALRHLGILAHRSGDLATAQHYLEQSLDRARAAHDTTATYLSRYMLAGVLLAQGHPAAAIQLYEECLMPMRASGDMWHQAQVLMFVAHAAIQLRDLERARAALREGVGLLRALGDRRVIAGCLEGFACLATVEDNVERAAFLFGCADAQRELVGAAADPVARPDTQAMRERAASVLGATAFEAAAARGRGASIEEALEVALVIEPTRVHQTLTRREYEVALLLARGLSNRAIAAELVISEQTAETHAKRVLSKLGLDSRTQLVARATELGFGPPTR